MGQQHNNGQQRSGQQSAPAAAVSVAAAVEDKGPVPGGFQSHEALEADAAAKAREAAGPSNKVVMGDGSPLPPKDEVPAEKMVKVQARRRIEPFTYGKTRYVIPQNQKVLIPEHVKNHLVEKGLLDG